MATWNRNHHYFSGSGGGGGGKTESLNFALVVLMAGHTIATLRTLITIPSGAPVSTGCGHVTDDYAH